MLVVQLVVAVGIAAVLAWCAKRLCLRFPIDARLYLRELRRLSREGDAEGLDALVRAPESGWLGTLAREVMKEAGHSPVRGAAVLEESVFDWQVELVRGLSWIRVGGRVAAALGLLGAILQLSRVLEGASPEARAQAVGAGLLVLTVGMASAAVASAGYRLLRAVAARLLHDVREASTVLGELLEKDALVAHSG